MSQINHYISKGWVLKVYAPIPGKWIFRSVLEHEEMAPIISESSTTIDGTFESLEARAKQQRAIMENAGVG